MNISKSEQRVLHVLAQGGHIQHLRDDGPRIAQVICYTRDGFVLEDCTLPIFRRLRHRGFVFSVDGGPYRISRLRRLSVRAQADNRR